MDPNEALKTIRYELNRSFTSYVYDEDALREAWEALDEWLKKGGFLPDDWARAHN
jgi:hypothetical protein